MGRCITLCISKGRSCFAREDVSLSCSMTPVSAVDRVMGNLVCFGHVGFQLSQMSHLAELACFTDTSVKCLVGVFCFVSLPSEEKRDLRRI